MKKASILAALSLLFLLGCHGTKRSISNSKYLEPGYSHHHRPSADGSERAFAYQGELNEMEVLGIARGEITSESEIRRALENARRVTLRPGAAVLLIQSGAMFPDGPMVSELTKSFRVVPFSGVPPMGPGGTQKHHAPDPETYSKSLRLTAARAGAEMILCYWGLLESESQHLATKTVSWVPVMNWFVPDEKQHLRLRLKIALIDVPTGNWAVLSPAPVEGKKLSVSPRRTVTDQKQVEQLKKIAYADGARELVRLYANGP